MRVRGGDGERLAGARRNAAKIQSCVSEVETTGILAGIAGAHALATHEDRETYQEQQCSHCFPNMRMDRGTPHPNQFGGEGETEVDTRGTIGRPSKGPVFRYRKPVENGYLPQGQAPKNFKKLAALTWILKVFPVDREAQSETRRANCKACSLRQSVSSSRAARPDRRNLSSAPHATGTGLFRT